MKLTKNPHLSSDMIALKSSKLKDLLGGLSADCTKDFLGEAAPDALEAVDLWEPLDLSDL